MADFRQLAVEFVLTDDGETQSKVAQLAADAIQKSPKAGNPVAKWVESIKPWISADSAEDDQMEDVEDGLSSGDVIARAKALQFLASTLELLDKDILRRDQVKLLVAFFKAMFTVDHRTGILPSAKSLTTICAMKAFSPESGNEIIQSVYTMGDEFRNQAAETRLAVYELLHKLVADAEVSSDLQYRHGAAGGFMTDMIQLCRQERDPKNIMIWFSILEAFLTQYSPSSDVIAAIFEAFSSYFPISLRTSKHPSGITAADLKVALRKCFCAHDHVSGHAFPYLIQKLDQAEGTSVDVKVDVLETLKQCMKRYSHVHKCISPFVDKVWSSLKYEVRNGEVTETINGTLDVIRTMASRLEGDELRNFILTVLRECLEDLKNPTYASQMGKLLCCAAGAKAGAFVMVVSPTVKQAKENLRHTRSKDHRRDLLALLNAILDVRLLFVGAGNPSLSPADLDGFKSTDPILVDLYEDCYKPNLEVDKTAGKKAVEGMGLLMRQPSAVAEGLHLLPESTCEDITNSLSNILADTSSDLADDAMVAMQQACAVWSQGLSALFEKALTPLHASPTNGDPDDNLTLLSRVTYVACHGLPQKGPKLGYFVQIISRLLDNLDRLLITSDGPSPLWSIYPAAIQMGMRHVQGALFREFGPDIANSEFEAAITKDSWVEHISSSYPLLKMDGNGLSLPQPPSSGAADAKDERNGSSLYTDFLLLCLLTTRHLYRRSTQIAGFGKLKEGSTMDRPVVALSKEVQKGEGNGPLREGYLHFLSAMATFVISQMTMEQQYRLSLHEDVFKLFRGGDSDGGTNYQAAAFQTLLPRTTLESPNLNDISADLPSRYQLPTSLSLGILRPLYPTVVSPLFDEAIGLEFMISKMLVSDNGQMDNQLPYLLLAFANKHAIEKLPKLLGLLEHQIHSLAVRKPTLLAEDSSLGDGAKAARTYLAGNIFATVAGVMRRHLGGSLGPLYEALRKAPGNPTDGHWLASNFGILFRPHDSIKPEYHSTTKHIWPHSAYSRLVKPMLPLAWPKRPAGDDEAAQGQDGGGGGDEVVCANYSIAVLSAARHLPFDAYREDASAMIRTALCVVRFLTPGPDVDAGLQVLAAIVAESPAAQLEPFLRSITVACVEIVGGGGGGQQAASASSGGKLLPTDYPPAAARGGAAVHGCRNQAIKLLGALPAKFEHRHLVESAPEVKRLLHASVGDKVREIRKTALAARLAWSEVE